MSAEHTQVQTSVEPGGDGHVSGHEAHVHVVPIWLLVAVFAVLLILTGLTVGVTLFDFGRTVNVWLALTIAVVKAGFVALFFMHLKWDSPFNGLVCVAAMFFVALFIGITLLDSKETAVNFQPPPVPAARPAE